MIELLAQDYAAAAATVDKTIALQRFTDITTRDEQACDAWIGRIACGDIDRYTLFRAWYSRRNFGRLASAADASIVTLNAWVPIGGQLVDLHAPVRSATDLSIAYALAEADEHNFNEALEALEGIPNDHMAVWAQALIHSAGQRWDQVIEILNTHAWGESREVIFKPCAELLKGVAAAHLGLWAEAEKRITEAATSKIKDAQIAVAQTAAWYAAMIYRAQGRESDAVRQLEWLHANYPSERVSAALKDPSVQLEVTTREQIAARTDPWDPRSANHTDESSRSELLVDAQARLDRTVGLTEVKEQVADLWAGAEMAALRAERNKKVSIKSRHLIFAGPPGTGKTSIAGVVADIYAGLGLIGSPKLVEATGKDLVAEYLGQTAIKTNKLVDSALDGVLFIDEAYTIVQAGAEQTGGNQFGHQAIDTLLARMENDRDRVMVIIAGYPKDLDRLLDANDGLRGRFATRINFPGYSADEIVAIAKLIAADSDSAISDDAAVALEAAAAELATTTIGDKRGLDVAGNGRYARNIVQAGEQARDRRLHELRRAGHALTDDMIELIEHDDMLTAIKNVNNNVFSGH
ncbi:type VII secretion AAA-ATPase EccA [Mycobacterium talmoniae]|uniref:Type VII secretion AAA-ATPase EccA n=1 Tax=Mycobacterium talmoniae TaxID=1858794 RepID=A0A1S1NCZ0_9MYCO|nr:type VII secretion AAA-ATPase EccA [Mycobacterium talmoniae]OHV03535.1 type VII secretion AAA-ATPase EccA [Mycobacterium talmoniae]